MVELLLRLISNLPVDLRTINLVMDAFADESRHWFFGGLAALLAYLLTLTICYALILGLRRSTHRKVNMVVDWRILILSGLLMLALVSISHYLLDGYTLWYNKPMGEPLHLIVP